MGRSGVSPEAQCSGLRNTDALTRCSGARVLGASRAGLLAKATAVDVLSLHMAYDETLADRVREALGPRPELSERKMFGGLCLMAGGHMFCGILGDELMLRLGPDGAEAALDRPHVRPMDFTGRPMKGMVYVEPAGFRGEQALLGWLDLALGFCATLPPK